MMLPKLVLLAAVASMARADWFDAAWFDGIVQIPLTIKESWNTLWIADLVIMNEGSARPYIIGGYCAVDNNAATSIIFSPNWGQEFSGWFSPDDAICTPDEKVIV